MNDMPIFLMRFGTSTLCSVCTTHEKPLVVQSGPRRESVLLCALLGKKIWCPSGERLRLSRLSPVHYSSRNRLLPFPCAANWRSFSCLLETLRSPPFLLAPFFVYSIAIMSRAATRYRVRGVPPPFFPSSTAPRGEKRAAGERAFFDGTLARRLRHAVLPSSVGLKLLELSQTEPGHARTQQAASIQKLTFAPEREDTA